MGRNKYGNQETFVDGHKFDSKAEAAHYENLKMLAMAEEIADLEVHPRFVLQDAFTKRGHRFRAITYTADFSYWDHKHGRRVVEDVKGVQTQVFKIKRKMFEKRYPDLILVIVDV